MPERRSKISGKLQRDTPPISQPRPVPKGNWLAFKLLQPDAKLPTRSNPTDAGVDFYAVRNQTVPAGRRVLVETGVAPVLPKGSTLILKDRSGLAAKHGLTILAGVIDEDYRGEIKVVLWNTGSRAYEIKQGDKFAQGVLLPVLTPQIREVKDLPSTARGEGGFGSTGA